jgi:RNA polymerase sigma-70 factor (ECF subfamily)
MELFARPMSDEEIVALFYARDERALDAVTRQYGWRYVKILRALLRDGSDVEECGNDVLLALWNTIPPQRPRSLAAYVCTLARRIGINRYKHNTRQKRGDGAVVLLSELGDALPDAGEGRSVCSEELARLLSDFLDGLSPTDRVLFVRRYVALESVGEIARRFGLRENAVAVRLHRTRAKLKAFLNQEGITI